jgi:hypothetical protein
MSKVLISFRAAQTAPAAEPDHFGLDIWWNSAGIGPDEVALLEGLANKVLEAAGASPHQKAAEGKRAYDLLMEVKVDDQATIRHEASGMAYNHLHDGQKASVAALGELLEEGEKERDGAEAPTDDAA